MSKYKEQRRQQIEEEQLRQAKRGRWLVAIGVVLVLSVGVAIWHSDTNASTVNTTSSAKPADEKRTLAALLALKPHQLEELDIALVNFLCAEGLPGTENLDVDKALDILDEMATRVRLETDRNMHQFRSKPDQFRNSEAYFRMMALATVLQQDFGIRYNPVRSTPAGQQEPAEVFFANSQDLFLHGLTGEKRSGTCGSLPVLYVAIGRRLKYPLFLVPTKEHLFVRWEDQNTRLNIEATTVGMGVYDDDHYRKWPKAFASDEEKDMGFLKNMTAAEEFADFLATRGHCLRAVGRFDEGYAAYEQALGVVPDSTFYGSLLYSAGREEAMRTGKIRPWIGMPPDPSLAHLPQIVAWGMWRTEQQMSRDESVGRSPGLASERKSTRQPGETVIPVLPPSPPKR